MFFDELGNGWPQHACSVASTQATSPDITVTQVLSALGRRVRRERQNPDGGQRRPSGKMAADLISVEPKAHVGSSLRRIMRVRSVPRETYGTRNLADLGPIAKSLLGLSDDDFDEGNLLEMTLEDSDQSHTRTYVAMVKTSMVQKLTLTVHMQVDVEIVSKGVPTGPAVWFVNSINPVEQSD